MIRKTLVNVICPCVNRFMISEKSLRQAALLRSCAWAHEKNLKEFEGARILDVSGLSLFLTSFASFDTVSFQAAAPEIFIFIL